MNSIQLEVENINKIYKIPSTNKIKVSNFLSKNKEKIAYKNFVALKNISFKLNSGEILGIIGNNGAGKSTLLKIIAEITEPSSGQIRYTGKIASILEIGTGFHPDLSGKENIFLIGNILGLNDTFLKSEFDNIVEYSEIGYHINAPVKTYSSGMFMRLAFSIIIHSDADILLLDEVFAVGDQSFKEKCKAKLKTLKKEGKIIILVSHELSEIQEFCTKCIILEKGKQVFQGSTRKAIEWYIEQNHTDQWSKIHHNGSSPEVLAASRVWNSENAPGIKDWELKKFNCSSIQNSNKINLIDSDIEVSLTYQKFSNKFILPCILLLYQLQTPVFISQPLFSNKSELNNSFNPNQPEGEYTLIFNIPKNLLNNGLFSFSLFLTNENNQELFHLKNVLIFKTRLPENFSTVYKYYGDFPGPILLFSNWEQK